MPNVDVCCSVGGVLFVETVPKSGLVIPAPCALLCFLLFRCSNRFERESLPGLPGTPNAVTGFVGLGDELVAVGLLLADGGSGGFEEEAHLRFSVLWLGNRHVSCAIGLVSEGPAYIPPDIDRFPGFTSVLIPILSILFTNVSFCLALRFCLWDDDAEGVFFLVPPMVCWTNSGIELNSNWGRLNDSYGSGDLDREEHGLPSGLLHGVAVGVKLFTPHGVLYADGVTALIPLSLSIFAKP